MRIHTPSGPVAITLTNLLTDVERDFFAREAELLETSGRVYTGAAESKPSMWRSLVALCVVASLAALGSFSIVRLRPDVFGSIVLSGQGTSASWSSSSHEPIVSVALAAPAAAPPTPVASTAVAPSSATTIAHAPSLVATAALVSTAPAATARATHRTHRHQASRHGVHARGRHRRS